MYCRFLEYIFANDGGFFILKSIYHSDKKIWKYERNWFQKSNCVRQAIFIVKYLGKLKILSVYFS